MTTLKIKLFKKRSLRVRNKLKKTSYGKCRLSVHRSSKNMYAQVIDDRLGKTLASVSSLEKALGVVGKNNIEAAARLGKEIASRALKKGIKEVVFDRGGFLEILKKYLDNAQIASDWEVLKKASEEVLVNSLSMLCPFEPEEKQVLLEAETIVKRLDVLVTLMKLSSENDVESRYVQ